MENELSFGSYRHTPYLMRVQKKYHHCTLDNFELNETHSLMVKAVRGFIEGDIHGLFLYGGFGVGKTHLLVSLYRIMVSKEDDISNVEYIPFDSIIGELKDRMESKPEKEDPYHPGSPAEYVDHFCNINLLFLDDITAANLQNSWTAEVLRKIVNGRYENDLRTCFTSNASPSMLTDLGLHGHAISRLLEMCKMVKLVGEDWRLKDLKGGE